ncbi:helix-turn-helix domain-containing protein [Bacteroides sp.]|uniref:helix-turn-helix domain-containing protein n=1 Tax=Bacteroides sp. TaxID=29523 RepID=UPI0026173C72|nr:helix-turn-helix domain-containing protein [Bacteroides sp.]MDD3040896.1 helix-turn-helix domain-containing protein [Bacteroides sp.]
MGLRGKVITEREELLICEQYLANWNLKKIAAFANLSHVTVLAILKRRDIPLREGKRLSKEQEDKVVELYNDGVSIVEIKNKSGVKSEQTVYRILRDAGVERRRNTEKK